MGCRPHPLGETPNPLYFMTWSTNAIRASPDAERSTPPECAAGRRVEYVHPIGRHAECDLAVSEVLHRRGYGQHERLATGHTMYEPVRPQFLVSMARRFLPDLVMM